MVGADPCEEGVMGAGEEGGMITDSDIIGKEVWNRHFYEERKRLKIHRCFNVLCNY